MFRRLPCVLGLHLHLSCVVGCRVSFLGLVRGFSSFGSRFVCSMRVKFISGLSLGPSIPDLRVLYPSRMSLVRSSCLSLQVLMCLSLSLGPHAFS